MKARIFNTAFWAFVGGAIDTATCIVWHGQSCGISSLAAGILFYTLAAAGLWFFCDSTIQGK